MLPCSLIDSHEDRERVRNLLEARLAILYRARRIAADKGNDLAWHRTDAKIDLILEIYLPIAWREAPAKRDDGPGAHPYGAD